MKYKILESVREILTDEYDVSEVDCKPEANLQTDLGLDSLDVIELLMKLDDKYKINFPDHESENTKTVQDIVNVVYKYINEK